MEKEKKDTGSASGGSLLSQNVYGVCFPQRDSVEVLHGELAAARRRFFTAGRKAVKVGRRETVKGFDGQLRGKISRWGFYWKKTALGVPDSKGIALEEAFDQKGGYVLVSRDFRGAIVSRAFFNKEHAWLKSEYYEPWDPGTAKVMFKPGTMEDTVERYDWDPDKKLYRSIILHPAPYQAGSAEQALVNARFGEPQLILAMEDGQHCYCPQKEAEARAQALEEINSGTMVLMPAWEIKEGAFLGEEGEEDTAVTFTSLEEYARVEPKEKPAPTPPLPIQAQARDLPETEFTPAEEPVQADELDIEFILADVRQDEAAHPPVQEPAPAEPAPEPAPPVWEEELNAVFVDPLPPQPPEAPKEPLPPPFPAAEDSAVLPVVREAMSQEPPKQAQPETPAPPAPAPPYGYAPPPQEPDPLEESAFAHDPGSAYSEEDSSILSAARHSGGAEPPRSSKRSGAAQPRLGQEEAAILSAARQSGGAGTSWKAKHGGDERPRLDKEDAAILSAARKPGGEPTQQGRHSAPAQTSLGAEDAAILSAARKPGGEPAQQGRHSAPAQTSLGAEDAAILSAARQSGNMDAPRRAGAQRHAQKSGPVVPRHSGPERAQPPAPPAPVPSQAQASPPPQRTPRKPAASASPATPAALDTMRAGKLTGKGRAEQPGGLTAYEGDYKDGKRQGFGSHYYKSGDLSYAGFWQDDKKDGLGVSFREGDHALHVSRWVQGKPGQQVSLFDREGSLRFGGRIVNGKKEGAGVSINSLDGSVMVTKWEGGQNTGLASAFDPEGNLLYYGSWKNGKRHGHGTEFDKNGGIVFDGEWRDDQYFNGILYQKPADAPPYADLDYGTEPDWEL